MVSEGRFGSHSVSVTLETEKNLLKSEFKQSAALKYLNFCFSKCEFSSKYGGFNEETAVKGELLRNEV